MGWNDHLDDPDAFEDHAEALREKADLDRKREREEGPRLTVVSSGELLAADSWAPEDYLANADDDPDMPSSCHRCGLRPSTKPRTMGRRSLHETLLRLDVARGVYVCVDEAACEKRREFGQREPRRAPFTSRRVSS